jgi:hypothetical protein
MRTYVDTIIPRNLSPVWRSTVLPGWGQYYNGSDGKGNLMFVSLLGTAGFLASSYNNYKSAERNFQSTANSMLLFPSDPTLSSLGYMNSRYLHSEYQSRANTVSIAAGVLLFIYACNLVDSFWFSNRTSQIQAPKVSPTEPSTPDKNVGLNVNVYLQPSTQNNSYSSEKVVLLNYTWRF